MNSFRKEMLYNIVTEVYIPMKLVSRSQWPRGLRHVLSSAAGTLGSWVRIPLEAWPRFFCVCVILCM
jgi:hypothetical protein